MTQSLGTLIVREAKLKEVASGGELHFALVIDAKSCKEGAGTELRFWAIHWHSPRPVSLGTGNLTPLSDASSTLSPSA